MATCTCTDLAPALRHSAECWTRGIWAWFQLATHVDPLRLMQVVLEFEAPFWDTSVDFFGAALPPGEAQSRGLCFMFWSLLRLTGAPILVGLVSGQVRCCSAQHSRRSAPVQPRMSDLLGLDAPSPLWPRFHQSRDPGACKGSPCPGDPGAEGGHGAQNRPVCVCVWGGGGGGNTSLPGSRCLYWSYTGPLAVQAAEEWEGRPVPELQEAAMKVLGTLFGDKATQPVASTASAWKSEPYILGRRWKQQ